jgi:hypothetical protein
MTTPSTSTTDDIPVPAQRPEHGSVDLDGELQLASLRRRFVGGSDEPVSYRKWDVERRLGSGGMGAVYLARNRELDRRVALKVVKPGQTGDAKAKAMRLIREAQALARIDHANVLRIHQVDTSGQQAVIEIEYVDGQTMREWQSQPERNWRTLVAAYVAAGQGLAAIHRAGILHRDIKPDNLLVDSNDRVKVADLGLAVAARSADDSTMSESVAVDEKSVLGRRLTVEGGWVGTHGYMAPEVIGGAEASAASDQFSLAVSLYEAVYGTRPFIGDSPEELAAAMQNGTLAAPREDRWRPRWLSRVLRRALRFDPAQRYPSVESFVGVLHRRLRLRAWFGTGAGVVALAVGSSVVGWNAKSTPVDPCADVGADMTRVWNVDVRSEISRKAGSQAAKALEVLVHTLDTRSEEWVETRTQLCIAEAGRYPASQAAEAELDARQHACLRYTFLNIEAVVAQLRAADDDLAQHYTESATAIEALPTCAERRQLMHWPLGLVNDDADVQLGRALALETAGRYPEAEDLARLVAETSAGQDPLRQAEALYRLGHILGLERRDRLAFETLDEARNVAFRLGHDELFCRAAAFQAKLGAQVHGNPTAASRELGLAQACVERLGARSPILRADLLEARGLLAQAAGEPEAAIAWHEEALMLRREHLGSAHLSTIKSLHNLANVIPAADPSGARADEVRRLYEECLDVRTRVLGDTHPDVADLLFDVGEFMWRRGEVEQARVHLGQAKHLYEIAPGEHAVVRAKIHLALAWMDIEASDLVSAERHLEQALALQDDGNEQMFAEVERARWLHLDGALALRRQDYSHAADSSRRATQLYRRHDPHSDAALDSLVDEIAADYGLGDYTRIAALVRDEGNTLVEYLRSLSADEGGPLAWYIGDALARQAAWAEAAVYFEIALASYERLEDSNNVEQLRAQSDRVVAEIESTTQGQ